MTGVGDVLRNARRATKRLRGWFPWNSPVNPPAVWPTLPPAFTLDFRETVWAATDELASLDDLVIDQGSISQRQQGARTEASSFRWGILLPICFHGGGTEDECWERLQGFLDSVVATTSPADRALLTIYVAIDVDDELFDTAHGRLRLGDIVRNALGREPRLHVKTAGWRHNICWLWDFLGREAVAEGDDFFVLFGDDVRLITPGWKHEIEIEFHDISIGTQLPFGVGVVAFQDRAFPVFPTFPVLHRKHCEIFGRVLPPPFENQEADPYLFQVYRRFGCSRFAQTAALYNSIGGLGNARYQKKKEVTWKGDLLTDSIKAVERYVKCNSTAESVVKPAMVNRPVCLDVVIPTFRCDKVHLRAMLDGLFNCVGGRGINPARLSVSVLVVVDNPDFFICQDDFESFKEKLTSWTNASWVRIWKQEINGGASSARNIGLRQSAGDYVLFLDDDVMPQPHLLEAYAGAAMRDPEASILVGKTSLPSPKTLLQHAFLAANLNFFYRVASELPNPPWGVTANLCVKNPERSGGGVYFDMRYPKTGGGEDINFCLTLKDIHMHGPNRNSPPVLGVPEAAVLHPFWGNIIGQVVGWSRGDVQCLDALPDRTFYALPNWAELTMLHALAPLVWMLWSNSGSRYSFNSADITVPFCGLFAFPVTEVLMRLTDFMATAKRDSAQSPLWWRLLAAVTGAGLTMLQDLTRLWSKLVNGRIYQLFLHFDWMDGQEEHLETIRLSRACGNVASLLLNDILRRGGTTLIMGTCQDASWTMAVEIVAWVAMLSIWCLSHTCECNTETLPSLEPLPLTYHGKEEAPKTAPFVVLGYMRTGTNLLCGRLFHCKPEIVMHNEMFDARHIWTYYREQLWKDPRWKWRTTNCRNKNAVDFIAAVYGLTPQIVQPDGVRAKAVGQKLLPHMWNGNPDLHGTFWRVMVDANIKKVVLRRKSALQVYVSLACAAASGEWISKGSDHLQVYIPPAAYMQFVKEYDAWYDFYASITAGQEVCNITFEDLTCLPGSTMREVMSFLGLPDDQPMPNVDVATRKQSTKRVHDKVANLLELQAAFRFTRWGSELM